MVEIKSVHRVMTAWFRLVSFCGTGSVICNHGMGLTRFGIPRRHSSLRMCPRMGLGFVVLLRRGEQWVQIRRAVSQPPPVAVKAPPIRSTSSKVGPPTSAMLRLATQRQVPRAQPERISVTFF